MIQQGNLVLDDLTIRKKIKRIAFEIYEQNFDQEEVILVGISDKGFSLAKTIQHELGEISPLQVKLQQLNINKENPSSSDINLSEDISKFSEKVIILVDDVINTASTLMYSLKPFLEIPVSKIEVAVLVNRSHTKFPIHPTYTGYELATTLEDHIDFNISNNKLNVYLR